MISREQAEELGDGFGDYWLRGDPPEHRDDPRWVSPMAAMRASDDEDARLWTPELASLEATMRVDWERGGGIQNPSPEHARIRALATARGHRILDWEQRLMKA